MYYKLIYFVLHPMMFWGPFDGFLRYKLIYFVVPLMILFSRIMHQNQKN